MGFFFKKRIKLFPGVYINLSKDGAGLSVGPKGAKYSINAKGEEYLSGGANGIYFREKVKNGEEEKSINEISPKTKETLEQDLDKSRLLRANAMRFLEKQNAIMELEAKSIISTQECEAIIDLLRKMN